MMDLAQTKQRRLQFVLLGWVLLFVGFAGSVMGVLKHLYVMKVAQSPIAKLVTALWDVPGVSLLWQHASLNSSHPSGDGWSVYFYVCLGIMLVSLLFLGLAKRLSHNIRESAQLAHVERLKNERLGYTHPPGSRITQISDSTIQGNFIGGDLGPHAQVSYTHNDLPTIKAHVNYILSHMDELPFTTPSQRVQFKTKLDAIQHECASPAPNQTLLRKALGEVGHTLRHIGEAGAAHVLVGHWQEIGHFLQKYM